MSCSLSTLTCVLVIGFVAVGDPGMNITQGLNDWRDMGQLLFYKSKDIP